MTNHAQPSYPNQPTTPTDTLAELETELRAEVEAAGGIDPNRLRDHAESLEALLSSWHPLDPRRTDCQRVAVYLREGAAELDWQESRPNPLPIDDSPLLTIEASWIAIALGIGAGLILGLLGNALLASILYGVLWAGGWLPIL